MLILVSMHRYVTSKHNKSGDADNPMAAEWIKVSLGWKRCRVNSMWRAIQQTPYRVSSTSDYWYDLNKWCKTKTAFIGANSMSEPQARVSWGQTLGILEMSRFKMHWHCFRTRCKYSFAGKCWNIIRRFYGPIQNEYKHLQAKNSAFFICAAVQNVFGQGNLTEIWE